MVSFNSSLPHHQISWHNLSAAHHNKRKRLVHHHHHHHHHVLVEDYNNDISEKESSSQRTKTINTSLLPLLTPLPFEWQRCLDIMSGQVYFYNTRTQEKTSRDPRLPPPNLDLHLNLLCGSSQQHVGDNFTHTEVSVPIQTRDNNDDDRLTSSENSQGGGGKKRSGGAFLSLARSPSWLRFDGEGDDEEEEMVTAVCRECHMLVMVCKTAPTCPNCKCVSLPAAGLDHMWSPN